MKATNPHRPSQRIVRKRNMQKMMSYARQQDPQRNDSGNQNARGDIAEFRLIRNSLLHPCIARILPRTGVMLELMAETV